jgi:hypothetical protein
MPVLIKKTQRSIRNAKQGILIVNNGQNLLSFSDLIPEPSAKREYIARFANPCADWAGFDASPAMPAFCLIPYNLRIRLRNGAVTTGFDT